MGWNFYLLLIQLVSLSTSSPMTITMVFPVFTGLQSYYCISVHTSHAQANKSIQADPSPSYYLTINSLSWQQVHENAPENIKCPACDKEFPEKKYFRKHLEQFHKELAPTYRYDYLCSICDKDFAYKVCSLAQLFESAKENLFDWLIENIKCSERRFRRNYQVWSGQQPKFKIRDMKVWSGLTTHYLTVSHRHRVDWTSTWRHI